MDSNYSVSVEKSIEIDFDGNKSTCNADDPNSSKVLLKLNGQTISEASLQDDNSLLLKCSNKYLLKINCIDDGNESYQVNFPDDMLAF